MDKTRDAHIILYTVRAVRDFIGIINSYTYFRGILNDYENY